MKYMICYIGTLTQVIIFKCWKDFEDEPDIFWKKYNIFEKIMDRVIWQNLMKEQIPVTLKLFKRKK